MDADLKQMWDEENKDSHTISSYSLQRLGAFRMLDISAKLLSFASKEHKTYTLNAMLKEWKEKTFKDKQGLLKD